MSEQELREALEQYAGPVTPPPGGRDLILQRVSRRRLRVPGAVAAAAAVALVVAGGLALRPSDKDPAPADTPPPSTTTAPYDAPGCPATLPMPGAGSRLPEEAAWKSVRFCSDTSSGLAGGEPETGYEGKPVLDPEALVFGIDKFARDIAAMPAADPGRCATISVLARADALVFTLEDGTQVPVSAAMCQDVSRGATVLDGQALRQAFLQALDHQRDDYGYERDEATALTCPTYGLPGPVRPGRERLVAAVVCPGFNDVDAEPRHLDAAQLDRLQEAWEKAVEAEWKPSEDEDECLTMDDERGRLLALTNRGDVLTMQTSPCDFLFVDRDPGRHWRIPITLEALR